MAQSITITLPTIVYYGLVGGIVLCAAITVSSIARGVFHLSDPLVAVTTVACTFLYYRLAFSDRTRL